MGRLSNLSVTQQRVLRLVGRVDRRSVPIVGSPGTCNCFKWSSGAACSGPVEISRPRHRARAVGNGGGADDNGLSRDRH